MLLRYPWYRFVWVTADPSADALYQALQTGFDIISGNGQFVSVWDEYRQDLPASDWQGRTVINLENPFYSTDIVPERYRHLLLEP